MKKILYLLLLFAKFSFGQNPSTYNKIIFEYNFSFFTSSKKEYFELVKQNNDEFRFIKANKTTETYNEGKIRIKNNSFKKTKNVSSNQIAVLLKNLNTNNDNFTSDFIRPNLITPKKSLIKKIIKEQEFILKYEGKKISEDSKKRIINEIIKFEKFEEFIDFEKPKTNALYGMVDGSESLKISFINKNDSITYTAETFHRCGQPITLLNNNDEEKKRIINLQLNSDIQNILPKNSLFRRQFDLNNITEKYIRWYINNL